MTKYVVLEADPPWQFKDALPGKGRGAIKHYPTMSLEEIKKFPIPELDERPLLFLWRVASMQQEALDVCKAWGFDPKAEIVWAKPQIGMGHYIRNAHEVCIIGARKGSSQRIITKNIPSWFVAKRGRHSAKPDEFYDIVDKLVGDVPKVRLFARKHRLGWDSLGNELPEMNLL